MLGACRWVEAQGTVRSCRLFALLLQSLTFNRPCFHAVASPLSLLSGHAGLLLIAPDGESVAAHTAGLRLWIWVQQHALRARTIRTASDDPASSRQRV